MPNNAAAEKRMRQEQKRRLHNRSIKSIVKTQVTKARQASTTDAETQLPKKLYAPPSANWIAPPKKASFIEIMLLAANRA